jgi:hypothetical protein
MSENVYDQSCRYLVGMDPAGFISWLLGLPSPSFAFRGWLDTRAIAYPGTPDHISDMVAHLVNLSKHGVPFALLLEFQITPDPEMFSRILSFLSAIWKFVKPDSERGSRFELGAAVINLTGQGNCSRLMHWSEAQLITHLAIRERNLEYESADDLLNGVANGQWPRSLLSFIPLMIGGDDPGIIDKWIALVGSEPEFQRRGDYAGIALTFADRVGRKVIWEEKLKEMSVTESAFLNEFIAKGEAKGRADEARLFVMRLASKRFGQAPNSIESAIQSVSDRERLERMGDRIYEAKDWDDLLATP